MDAEGWNAVGSLLGGIGGTAGLFALGLQVSERRRSRALSHIPPEVRPLLIEISRVAGEIQVRNRDRDWVELHVLPLREKYTPLADIILSAKRLRSTEWSLLDLNLMQMQVRAYDPRLNMRDPAQVASDAVEQRSAANEAKDHAQTLLRRISA